MAYSKLEQFRLRFEKERFKEETPASDWIMAALKVSQSVSGGVVVAWKV